MTQASSVATEKTPKPGGCQAEKIRLIGINKLFEDAKGGTPVVALSAVDMTVNEGEFFTLLGPSGCGKTTLLRLLAGFEVPSSGQVLLDGKVVNELPAQKRRVNTVFQSYALFPHLTVEKNIAFSLEMQRIGKAETADTVKRMLALVRLEGIGDRYPEQLSGGQQQRVALARALASRPSLLLLDEPLSALDLRLRREMQSELKRIQTDTGTTFVYVTHDQEEALAMSDRIAVMKAGRVHQIGTPREIYQEPVDLTVCKFIGDINLIKVSLVSQSELDAQVALPNGVKTVARCGQINCEDTSLHLAFRPEDVALTDPGNGLFDAEIENSTYVGSQTILRLKSEFGDDLVALCRDKVASPLVSGQPQVGVEFSGARVLGGDGS